MRLCGFLLVRHSDLELRIQGLPKVFKYPQLSQKLVKLRTSVLAGTFTGSIPTISHLNFFWEKGAWAYPGTAKCFKVPANYLRNG